MSSTGFRLTGTRRIARIGFLTVDRLHLLAPGDEHVVRVAVLHPGAIAVVPIVGDDVVLISQYRAPIDDVLLEIPAGKLDQLGEDLEAAARREVEEEIGYAAGTLTRLTTIETAPGFSDERITIFEATDLTPVPMRPSGAEERAAEVVRIPFDEAVSAVLAGRITDAKTAVGLLIAAGLRD